MKQFIEGLPKVELHLHIEGSLEPELMFEIAQRNNIEIPFSSPAELKAAYQFEDLQSFLDIYYQGANVLINEQDFYDLTWDYLLHCKEDNVMHTEIFFDPQTHTSRGIAFDTVINGIHSALIDAEKELEVTSNLIMCFLRHLDEESAFETLEEACLHKDKIVAVGLDSSEQGNPPEKFQNVFKKALEEGFLAVAHAGEEGPAQNIEDAIKLLGVSRVDHGVRCVESDALVEKLIKDKMPLTVCPLSNLKLKVFKNMADHNIVELLRKGVKVTINSDDPAYFGGYMTDNFLALEQVNSLTTEEWVQFSINAINASFITDELKENYLQRVKDYAQEYNLSK